MRVWVCGGEDTQHHDWREGVRCGCEGCGCEGVGVGVWGCGCVVGRIRSTTTGGKRWMVNCFVLGRATLHLPQV